MSSFLYIIQTTPVISTLAQNTSQTTDKNNLVIILIVLLILGTSELLVGLLLLRYTAPKTNALLSNTNPLKQKPSLFRIIAYFMIGMSLVSYGLLLWVN